MRPVILPRSGRLATADAAISLYDFIVAPLYLASAMRERDISVGASQVVPTMTGDPSPGRRPFAGRVFASEPFESQNDLTGREKSEQRAAIRQRNSVTVISLVTGQICPFSRRTVGVTQAKFAELSPVET